MEQLVLLLGPRASARRPFGLEGAVGLDPSLQRRIPVVRNGFAGSAGKQLGNLGPLVPEFAVGLQDDPVLLRGPRRLLDVAVQDLERPEVMQ